MQLLDGKELAATIREEMAEEVRKMTLEGLDPPHLSAVLVGNDGASETYVAQKVKACEAIGMKSTLIRLDDDVSEADLLQTIDTLNNDDGVDGFIVQLPLPDQINEEKVKQAILPSKDVDGFHPVNMGRMAQNLPAYLPATPSGIMTILDRYQIETEGKHCVVLGRSKIVGLPMSILMARKTKPGNSTVTICHKGT